MHLSNVKKTSARIGLALVCGVLTVCLSAKAGSAAQPETEKSADHGVTMHITQEIDLGDLSCSGKYTGHFLPLGNFRVEGKIHAVTLGMTIGLTIVSNGHIVKQLSETPFGPMAHTVDLDRIGKLLPGYDPSETYDPALYKEFLKSVPNKKELPSETMDGARVEGYEVPLERGRMTLPSNVPFVLPEPAAIRVWINPEDGVARKVELVDAQGHAFMKMFYTKVRTGVSIPAKMFELEFPPNVTPTDITEVIIGGRAAVQPLPKQSSEPPEKKQKQTND